VIILIVEDDAPLAGLIGDYLRRHGFEVRIEGRGDRALARILDERPALVVLDLTLPGEDGLSVCRRARPRYAGPILMLTARGDDLSEVMGLDAGADDYLQKPVRPRVLLARVQALLRRGAAPMPDEGRLQVGPLSIDRRAREAAVAGTPLELTSGEFDLLWLLASHAGKVLSRQALLERLRGVEYDGIDRSVDLRVSRLRQKIGALAPGAEIIKSVRGVGYLYKDGA
jgi:two-component system, OmpR family, response regulator RstA